MTRQQPKYLSQGVNYLGFLSQQLGDLAGTTTLAHELIQNADDAKDDLGRLAATRITFDITDTALIVSNDAVFREIDFERMQDVASGSKRGESGDRTTGAFGVGFISVYQITDRPEIHSAGRTWILRPDYPEDERIEFWQDPAITVDGGTVFRLPWAFEESGVRRTLKAPTVDAVYIDSLVDDLKESLPISILFLKKLDRIELRRNGEPVSVVTRKINDDTIQVDRDGDVRCWRILEANFPDEAVILKDRYDGSIAQGRSDHVRVAVPDSLIDDGLLFATLPTEQSTGFPFHIDADFFPASDRKAIEFGDAHDPRSEWNRAAIRAAASALRSNLIPLRDMYSDAPSSLWSFLSCIHEVHHKYEGNVRLPLGEFWESLLPSLGEAPIVYTESDQWLVPSCTRIPTGQQEAEAVHAFQEIGIEIVHRDLWRNSRNLLTSRDVGVRRISATDVFHYLKERGYADGPISSLPVNSDSIDILRRGIAGVLANEQGRSRENAEGMLGVCSLAPGLDGRLWPCRSAFRSDERTRQIFAPLLPNDTTFLADERTPLLDQLCPKFTAADAIEILSSLDTEQLENRRSRGEFNPVHLLQWLGDHKIGLTADQRAQLAGLPIFPSAKSLHPLPALRLPGGFEDSLGVADILDSSIPDSLFGFLQELGVRQLTFEDYAGQYVPKAFAKDSTVDKETKRKLLATLERHIGGIRDNDQVRAKLSTTRIVECEDGEFRQPGRTYFRTEEVERVLEDWAAYALVLDRTESRRDLYRWLGVESQPRITDMLQIVNHETTAKATSQAKSIVVKMLEALGRRWEELDESDKSNCRRLKTRAWLPREADATAWYRPDELFATYNKNLFEFQGMFLDAPVRIQQNIRPFLAWLGVNLSPQPFQVVRHLLTCSEMESKPPDNIYQWLNDNARPNDLQVLRGLPCLWIPETNRYLRPDQVFWGSHPFGRYRVKLGSRLRSYQQLLKGVGVREKPEFNDAIEVLKDVSKGAGSSAIEAEDKKVVIHCWFMLADALEGREVDTGILNSGLRDIPCVPTKQDRLHPPLWMLFEDRSGLADKFPGILDQNCIPRTERAWLAMEAAGVRPVSEVVRGYVAEKVNPREDYFVSERVSSRVNYVRTILEGAGIVLQKEDPISVLKSMRFIQVDELTVRWRLLDFIRDWPEAPPEAISAHWDKEEQVLFFTNRDDGAFPWSAIARELTLALVPSENLASISPGLKSVLEAGTVSDAGAQLSELGIAAIQSFDEDPAEGPVADSLGGDTSEINDQNQAGSGIPNIPGGDQLPGGNGDSKSWFARHLHRVQTTTPSASDENPVVFPPGGPDTSPSASAYTDRSIKVGQAEPHVLKLVTQSERGPKGQALEDEFRSMVHGDYGRRCQICSRTFTTTGSGWLVNVVHVVPPRKGYQTNHFGDLLGLCGWHYNLLRYGEWAFLDPNNDRPFEDMDGIQGWERMRNFILNCEPDIDDMGNPYVGLPVRFSNVYQEWQPEPSLVTEKIRYSIPHWKFLCALMRA